MEALVASRVRVLVVDDSVMVRRLLTEALGADPEIEVIGTASNGRIALARIEQLAPDVVTLDVEMPEMGGLETLVEIRRTHPRLPVVMFSALTERAASTTLEALMLGATDYFAKPGPGVGFAAAVKLVQEGLGTRLKAFARQRQGSPPDGCLTPRRPNSMVLAPPQRPASMARIPDTYPQLLAIGASTGGPNAIADVIARLAPLPVPTVITQHMPPVFTRTFAQRLDSTTAHRVREAVEGDVLLPGQILIAPGGFHMRLRREGTRVTVHLDDGPPENSCRPAVDVMFRSAVEVYGGAIVGVILTGMGQDGLRGCELFRAAGGQVVAQDEASSVVWGMPGYVARAQLAHAVVPLHRMSSEIAKRIGAQPADSASGGRDVHR